MPPASTPWTEWKVEELRRLWAAGYSATEIAGELGGGFGRCAVLGKVNRLGLTRRKPPQPRKPQAATVPRGRPVLRRPVFIAPAKEQPPMLEPPLPSLPRMRRLQLMQLGERHCRWPFGDPMTRPFYFCAADRALGEPYCAYHMARAFAKLRQR